MAGASYQRVALQSGKDASGDVGGLNSSTGNDVSDNYNTEWITDISYKSDFSLGGIIEYASVTPTVGGKEEDALTGAYAEYAYKAGKSTAYAGRGVNLTSSSASTTNYKNNIFLATSQPIFTNSSSL